MFFSPKVFAVDIYPMYCVGTQFITLKTLGFDGEDNEILDLKANRAAKVEFKKLNEILTANFKSFHDKSGGSVAFVRGCSNLDIIQAQLLKALADKHAGVMVQKINIKPQNTLDSKFSSYRFISIQYDDKLGSSGTFRAIFETNDFSRKNIFFRYSFEARMPVLVALKNINMRHILGTLDYTQTSVEFDKFNKGSLTKPLPTRLIARSNIRRGEILLARHFAQLPLVKKGEKLNAVITDAGLSVLTEVTATQDGELGENISVRAKDGRFYKAIVSSSKEVIIK